MNAEQTRLLLYKFIDHNTTNISRPFSQQLKIGKYLCATNGKSIILIPETSENKLESYEQATKPPNIDNILPEFSEDITLDRELLFTLYKNIPIITAKIVTECDSCEGEGTFDHCGHDYDCEKCNRTGKIDTGKTEEVRNPKTVFCFNEINLDMKHMLALLEVGHSAKTTSIKIVKFGKCLIWFKLDEILLAFVGKNFVDDETKWDNVIVNLK